MDIPVNGSNAAKDNGEVQMGSKICEWQPKCLVHQTNHFSEDWDSLYRQSYYKQVFKSDGWLDCVIEKKIQFQNSKILFYNNEGQTKKHF